MNKLFAGFSRVNVTPKPGVDIAGYYQVRIADGILDEQEINALALSCGEQKVLMLSMDHCGIKQDLSKRYRAHISEVTGVPAEAIFIHCTHSHTAASLKPGTTNPLNLEYKEFIYDKIAEAAVLAIGDLKPAKVGYGEGQAPNVAFVRRFRMKDGSIRTNPGVNNPDIVAPIGEVDERVNVVRFDQQGGKSLVLVHFGNHPDMVGGCKLSCDWPGFLRKTVEKVIDDSRCIFFNGAQGDINHVNVHPADGFLNDTFNDFDDVSRGYGHARYVGRVVAAGVLQCYDKVKYVDVDTIAYAQKIIEIPANLPTPEELPEAHRISELYHAGRDSELGYEGMMLTTKVAEAERMVRLENGPEIFHQRLSAIRLGNIGFCGIPGEPFTGIGRALKETEGYELVCPMCLVNGAEGYYPMQEAYDEGGYEAASSPFKAGVAEKIIAEGFDLLKGLKE